MKHTILICQLFTFFLCHLSLLLEVAFSSNQKFDYVFIGIGLDLLDPASNVFKWLFVINAIG